MRFRIHGVDKETGNEIEPFIITADSEREAISRANSSGIMPSSVKKIDDPQPNDSIPDTNINETKAVPRRNPNDSYEDVRASTTLNIFGGIAFFAGLACSFYFCFVYETSVSTGAFSLERVSNVGLMNNRLVGVIAGMGLSLIGTICFVAGIVIDYLDTVKKNLVTLIRRTRPID